MNIHMPRFLHRWYAVWNGYFWLPCPLCGKYFGGHEWVNSYYTGIPVPGRPGVSRGICENCITNQFYECGICEQYHRVAWNGDCRDDANRFSASELTIEELANALTMEEMVG